ncbi:hypothetical protein S7711_00722 [Stachybotrys chartarum IBT 7711]|uniref:RRN7-type domain-containing protein n=1 Tax=Stachybotrys chartarum (strain CBS 109288 / IBT 7711) TaxID=1280523 RepID=A0A084AZZ7_STACB|nr:hypothetical protein S7711_00722 [Stachybotrys chartarum IBT 7711]
MEERRQLHRMPPGQSCSECKSRKYYVEAGHRYCRNDHQLEGFIQYDLGDEQDAGRHGAVARREKEVRVIEKRHLTGAQGKLLYLEALQLILRNQLLWLIYDKGHREELETVVRDLWDLRLRGSSSLVVSSEAEDGELATYGSQATEDQSAATLAQNTRAQSWDPDLGKKWPLPRMPDTLGLCYLGCVLLRIPTRIGQFIDWANTGHVPYKRAYWDLPQEMRDRMPSSFTRVLKLPSTEKIGEDLYNTVMTAALSWYLNYNMILPPIEHTQMLVQTARLLTLPFESIIIARKLASILGYTFQVPIDKSRIFPLDHPEIMLVSLLIVATKLAYPLDGGESALHFGHTFRFNWKTWIAAKQQFAEQQPQPQPGDDLKIDEITPEELVAMEDDELDQYFSRVSGLIDKTNDNPITRFFPQEPIPPIVATPELARDELDKHLKTTLQKAYEPTSPEGRNTNEDCSNEAAAKYEAYRSNEDLTDTARSLYEASAHAAGTSLETIVRSVHMLELRLNVAQRNIDMT